ncbi:hypothetical protein IW262DRAFT_1462636 [Armillaria fumosa]|nr:hypothetical protein IW262DRAFT_1462636 [Armillaria fumosa]
MWVVEEVSELFHFVELPGLYCPSTTLPLPKACIPRPQRHAAPCLATEFCRETMYRVPVIKGRYASKDGKVADLECSGGAGYFCLVGHLTLRCSPSPTAFSSKPKAATIIPRTCGEMTYRLPVSKGRGSGTYEPKMFKESRPFTMLGRLFLLQKHLNGAATCQAIEFRCKTTYRLPASKGGEFHAWIVLRAVWLCCRFPALNLPCSAAFPSRRLPP